MSKVRLAVVGCGAQAQLHHLPAIVQSNTVELAALVDTSMTRARQIADTYGVPIALDDHRDLAGRTDAAVVVLPNYLHAPVTVDLARLGIHVLVEKPMALTRRQCGEMIEAAKSTQTVLAVGLNFRFFQASRFVKRVLERKLLGDLISFDFRMGDGLPSSYVMKSDYLLRADTAGGGVLIDLAVHGLDLLLWWLGDYARVDYYDDALGGVEANCELHLQLTSGASGTAEFSRIRRLRNTCTIEGEQGTLEVGLWTMNGLLRLKVKDDPLLLKGEDVAANETSLEIFRRQVDDFADAITGRREPFVPGHEGRRSIELIEDCYAGRRELREPWMFPLSSVRGASPGVI